MALRILFAIHAVRDPHTAVFMNVCSRADHLRRLGHAVDIATPEDVGMSRRWGGWPLLYAIQLAARGRLTTYDLVVFHSHSGWAFALARPLLARGRRVAIVTAFHGLEPLYHRAEQRELARVGRKYGLPFRVLHVGLLHVLTKLSCRRSDAVFCLNTTERDYVVEHRWCDAARAVIVHNGVERELFTSRQHRDRATTMLFVGQWLARKGIRYLTSAFKTVAERRPALRLVCAGTGRDADAVLGDFDPAIRDRVRVYPRVDRAKLGGLLRDADVFVFPSLFEGSSGALLEAMAASLGVVATPAGAAADILQDGRNAVVVPCADEQALARAIERVVDDAVLRDRLARAAHETALACEWSQVNEHYAAHLLDAVQFRVSAAGAAASA